MGGVAVAVGHGADGSGSAYGYARSLGLPIGAGGVEVASANAAVVRLCMGVARGVRGAALLLGRRVGGCAEAVAHPWRWASSGLELSSAWGPCGASCCGSSEMSHAIPPRVFQGLTALRI